jgi:hypothetical protein
MLCLAFLNKYTTCVTKKKALLVVVTKRLRKIKGTTVPLVGVNALARWNK